MIARRHCAHAYANGATCGLYATGGGAYCSAHQRPHFEKERRERERARLRDAIADVAVEMVHIRIPKTPARADGSWTVTELLRARRTKECIDGAYCRLRALVAALDVFDRTGTMPRGTARRLKP